MSAGPSIYPGPPTSTLIDWSDNHWLYVKRRILTANPTRAFGSIVQASEWPLQTILDQAFYLIIDNIVPGRGENVWSSMNMQMGVRWAWKLTGSDNPGNAIMYNRGDRYVNNFQMIQELTFGLWPGYCQKMQWVLDQTSGQMVGTPYVPRESLTWRSKPRFDTKFDSKSGMLFGYCKTAVCGFTPTITA